ncbi:MAG: hypothetical protein Q7R67_00900 [bacterium]|nr:hypothetical protein [bacterium]
MPHQEEEQLRQLQQALVDSLVGVSTLGLKDEKDVTVLFPPDSMQYGLGTEIIVEITLYAKPERTAAVLDTVAGRLGATVFLQYPHARVEVFVYPIDPRRCWVSH